MPVMYVLKLAQAKYNRCSGQCESVSITTNVINLLNIFWSRHV